jgi:hypothetical protein
MFKRKMRIAVGIGLVFVSLAAAGAWFFWFGPWCARMDPLWGTSYSPKAYWENLQPYLKRFAWFHEDHAFVGAYGNKDWASWIIAKAEAGEDISNCAVGHKDEALKKITGQDPTFKKRFENPKGWVEKQWVGWWATNKHKTQVEWIQDGLAQYGVRVTQPLDSTQVLGLLELIGTRSTNKTEQVPYHIKYNSFRWLRDSRFDSMAYALTNATSLSSEKSRRGLEWYDKFSRSFRKEDGIGLLFSETNPPPVGASKPDRRLIVITAAAYACMIMPLLGAFVLLRPLTNRHLDHVTGDQA